MTKLYLRRLAGAIAAAGLTLAPAASHAAAFLLESVPDQIVQGPLSFTDDGLTMTVSGEGGQFLLFGGVGVPLLGQVAVSAHSTNTQLGRDFVPIRFSFDHLVTSITANFGDRGLDDDGTVTLTAYNAAGALLGSISANYPSSESAGKTLQLSVAGGASYFIGSTNASWAPNSVGWDIADVQYIAAVPEPAAWALMILGFGAGGTMLRTRRRLAA